MRVALVHPNFVDTGSERYIWSLAHHLLERGVQVHVFASRFGEKIHPAIQRHPIPRRPFPRSLRPYFFERLTRRAVSACSFDLVHGFGKTVEQDIYTEGSGLSRSFADYQDSRSSFPLRRLRPLGPARLISQWLEIRRYRHPRLRKVLFMSLALQEEFSRRYALSEKQSTVVHSAVDCRRFTPPAPGHPRPLRKELGIGADDLVLLMVGNDFQRKNVDTALRALALLDKDSRFRWHLLVVGRDRADPLLKLAARLGIAGRTRFAGPRMDVERYFQAADLFLHPARFEAFGIVVLEAMSSGLPVLVSRRAGSHEVVEPGAQGCLLQDVESPRAIADAVVSLSDPELRCRMGGAARARALEFDWTCHIGRILDLYQETAA